MSRGRTIGTMETWEPEDKSFTKHILERGHGDGKPNKESVCTVLIHFVDEVELQDLGQYVIGSECEVTVGEGDTLLSELFDSVLLSMLEGEFSYVKAKTDWTGKKVDEFEAGKSALKFKITLKSLSRAANSSDLDQDERLDRAQHHKQKGTELFQKGVHGYAVKRWETSLKYLDDMEPREDLDDGLRNEQQKLKCACLLNLAACDLKQNKFEETIKHCTKALEMDDRNVKGLFRRAQAYSKLHKYEEAKDDLNKVLEIEPGNKAVKNEIINVNELVKKEKRMYQKMFTS